MRENSFVPVLWSPLLVLPVETQSALMFSLDQSSFFAAILVTRSLSNSLCLTLHANMLTPICCQFWASSTLVATPPCGVPLRRKPLLDNLWYPYVFFAVVQSVSLNFLKISKNVFFKLNIWGSNFLECEPVLIGSDDGFTLTIAKTGGYRC